MIFKLKAPIDPPCILILDGYVAFRRLIRAFVLLYSCVCICGVDLTIFPQRLAKTEISGISLMDLGVGMIVVAIGLSNASFLDVAQTKSKRKVVETLMRATIPCLVIGGIQTLTTNVLGYPDHETEYGIHWNFFFTLAFIRVSLICNNQSIVSTLFFGMGRKVILRQEFVRRYQMTFYIP